MADGGPRGVLEVLDEVVGLLRRLALASDDLVGLNAGDVLTISQASRALQMRESDARAWLRGCDLIRTAAGRERVIWGDVLAAIRRGDAPARAAEPARGSATLPRARL